MNNNPLQVFAGGWQQLEHAKLKDTKTLDMGTPVAVFWKPDGTKVFVLDSGSDELVELTASIPHDISTLVKTFMYDISNFETNARAMDWSKDGKTVWILGTQSDTIHQLDLSVEWDLSTISNPSIDRKPSGLNVNPQALRFSNDGLTLFAADTSGELSAYSLSLSKTTIRFPNFLFRNFISS